MAGLIASGTARAQETIATAKTETPPAPSANAPPLLLPRHAEFDDEGPPLVGPCGAVGAVHDGVAEKPDKKPHGEVFAGVGTAGYREVGGVVCMPIGDHAAVSVAVDYGRIGH
jgi:hypothetical protein